MYVCLLNSNNEKAAENESAQKNNIGRKLLNVINFTKIKISAE